MVIVGLKNNKIDITDRVVGKLKDGEIELYLENERIGSIRLPKDPSIQMDHHFETDMQKIYQHVTTTESPQARYTDCDEGGWC
ncbi:YusG family protein [Cytobacillus massiliigabonensis]|uniref:YusG family protein n=1 Tax=Cytobacillus massiliigabonensis TaxID=1871011 RepID=UPI000C8439AF|nr:YusG family protein [Cytobacillus massiliigabonensis]